MTESNGTALQKLKAALDTDLTDYQPIPFWSWNNTLDKNELIRQIEDMKSVGIGGFIMHARTGLRDEYLGEKWFSCVEACLDKAKELGMNAWIYDENGWPSGFVGGKLLKNRDYRARFLTYTVKDSFDSAAFCVYKKSERGYVRIDAPEPMLSEYHCVYLQLSPANTDILNPEVVDAFISETHERYYARFADRFGKELVGFFTDEPQYYRWGVPYTPVADKPFAQRWGADIRDGLIYLFLHDANGYEFRQRYYLLLNELYVDNFYKRLYGWCTEHNCKLTGHSIEEATLSGQMMGGAGVMTTYRYEHIPAIDCLSRRCKNEAMGKQIGSVASQFGIKQVLTETFACSGYDVTPKELKSLAEFQFFNGVNLLCHHLYPYSIAAQGKCDHPPVFSPQGNWFDEFKTFNDYFTRLGFLLANTSDVYDVLIIHPLRDAYLDYVATEGPRSTGSLDRDFADFLLMLRKRGICYHFADERILEECAKNEDGGLVIGNCRYDTVLVPRMRTVSEFTVKLLQSFTGKLCVLEQPEMICGVSASVSLDSNTDLDEIQRHAYVSFSCEDGNTGITARKGELGDFLFLKNYSLTESSSVCMQNVAEHYKRLDLETMTLSNISNQMTLGKSEGMVLIRDQDARVDTSATVTEDITSDFRVVGITENYLTLDNVSISYNGIDFSETLPLQRHVEDLLRADYRGKLWVKYRFTVADKLPISLMIEREKYTSVTVNNKPFTLRDSDFDINFAEADLTEALVIGENELIYSIDYYQHDGVHFALFDPLATESLRNCLYYDTNLENVYLKGDFTVDAQRVIHRREGVPPITSALYNHGYPFFKGSLILEGCYHYNGNGNRVLSLDKGRFLVANVTVNGGKTELTLDTKRDITSLLQTGENKIKIELKSSLRNLLGPHHLADNPDPISVSPIHFTMRGTWNGDIPPNYTPNYNSVPFGVDVIEMIADTDA